MAQDCLLEARQSEGCTCAGYGKSTRYWERGRQDQMLQFTDLGSDACANPVDAPSPGVVLHRKPARRREHVLALQAAKEGGGRHDVTTNSKDSTEH